ncbi:MAG: redoxin domain-containing protein [Planctomycetota bacterium]
MSRSKRPARILAPLTLVAAIAAGAVLVLKPIPSRSNPPTAPSADAPRTAPMGVPATTTLAWAPQRKLADTTGQQRELDKLRGPRGVVIVFLSTECPISRAYVPALNELHAQRHESGVAVVGVEANDGRTAAEVAEHIREFAIGFPVLLDPRQSLADTLKIETCPTAVLFDAQGQCRYHGRVDDRFTRRGGAAAAPKTRELVDAVASVAAGRQPTIATTKPLGCPLRRSVDSAPVNSSPANTANRNTKTPSTKIASPATDAAAWEPLHRSALAILRKRCGECHRDGGIGPMDLHSESTALAWADDVVRFTQDGSMPPWKPVAGWGDFKNSRRIPAEEIELLRRWGAASATRPTPASTTAARVAATREPSTEKKPTTVNSPAASNAAAELPPRPDWRLGTPDLILEPESTYVLGADGTDEYRCFVFPTRFAEDRFVRVFEIQPGNSRVVHHVLTFIDTRKAARKLDEAEPTAGYLTEGGWPGFLPSGSLGGWAPGNVPSPLPEGTVRVLPAGADVVMQVHYHRSGKPEPDRTRIGLYFSQTPPERAVRMMPVMLPGGPLSGLRIPANEPRYRRDAEMVSPAEIDALAVTPHMHLLGREISLEAFLPDGTSRKMVKVDRWDFNWQETYRFVEPVRLPKGTRLRMELAWDNSADNPANPHRPPRDVRWGEQTTEEMGMVFVEAASTKRATDPSQVRAPTADEQIRFYVESQAANRQAGKVTWQFELVLRAMEAKLRAFDRGLAPSFDGLPIP